MVDISDILRHSSSLENQTIELDIKSIDYDYNNINLDKTLTFVGDLSSMEKVVTVKGKVELSFKIPCYLCMQEFEYSQIIEIDEVFKNAPEEDEYPIQFEQIDLERAVMDNIILQLPTQFICREDCRGICPICGKNRNESNCNCEEKIIDPRFEKLKELL